MKLGQIGIRRAETADAVAIADVHEPAWRLAYAGLLPGRELERMIAHRGPLWWKRALDRQTVVLVLEVAGAVRGYATLGPNRKRTLPFAGEIYELYVAPEFQGLGFGRTLFAAARAELRRFGLASFSVRVLAENVAARAFFFRLGAQPVEVDDEILGEKTMMVDVFGFAAE